MSYIVKIYLDSEKIPDAVTMSLLTKQAFDLETKTAILKTLDTIIETQKAILQGVVSGQITVVNKSKGEEELNESIRE